MLDRISDRDLGEELIALRGTVNYLDYLSQLARATSAQAYLEIGTQFGSSLAVISCASIAIDPCMALSMEIVGKKPVCMLFQMTGDDFFKLHDPTQLLGRPIDLAFLDGMHLYEFLLRDLINTEKHCQRDSMIVLHDCLPLTFEMTSRECRGATLNEKYLNYWTGDIWKIIPILRSYRPDLVMVCIDAPPTGLVILTNLDPSSNVLETNYDRIVARYCEAPGDFETLRSLLKTISLTPSTHTDVLQARMRAL